MASIKPLPCPTSFNDNKYSSWGDNTRPCVLCSIGAEFSDYHLLRHSQTTGRAEAFNNELLNDREAGALVHFDLRCTHHINFTNIRIPAISNGVPEVLSVASKTVQSR